MGVDTAWVGNRVWNDLNGNGWQQPGEPGVADVEVRLIADGSTTPTAVTTTDARGIYNFRNISPGTYTIEVVAPEGWAFTTSNRAGTEVGDSDADASGVMGPVTLGPDEVNTHWDAGILAPDFSAPAWVGNRIWNDVDTDGRQDPGEPGVSGVEVKLIAEGSTTPVDTAVTNDQGLYNFREIPSGTYTLQVVAPPRATFTAPHQGPNDIGDSDADGSGLLGPLTLDAGEVDTGWDAGLVFPGWIGNRVWNDLNGDGWQRAGEPGVAGVAVRLMPAGSSTPAQVTTTNAQGIYNFRDVDPGTYSIEVVRPAGWSFTTPNRPGTEFGDSDAEADGTMGPIVLGSRQVNTHWDAGLVAPGFVAPAWVGNRVWNDFDGDGVQDNDELGVPGIEVNLISDGASEPIRTVVTDLRGLYNFKNVAPGSYRIEVVAPDNFSFTTQHQGREIADSDADASGVIGPFALAPGEVNTHLDAGLRAGPTYLSRLEVTGAGIDVHPNFSPLIQRYSVNPSDATDGVSVTAYAASILDTLTINGEAASSGVPVSVSGLAPGDKVQIEVSNPADGTRSYEIIYLPVDFPTLEVTTLEPGVTDGMLYLTLRRLTRQPPNFIAVVDNYGVPTFVRETAGRPSDFKRHPNGVMSYAERNGEINQFGRESVDEVLLDENFNEIARLNVVGDLNHTDAHDFLILPNGNLVFLAYNGEVRDGTVFEDSVIQVVNPATGEEVFRWNSKDDIPMEDVLRNNRQEYAHINSVFVDDDGNFLASLRGTSQVIKIDSTTADVIWKLGGLSSDFAIDDPFGGPCGQHTATRLAGGHIMVFDNGSPCPDTPEYATRGQLTRVSEYAVDETAMTAELVWSYSQPGFYTTAAGSAERLDNGNTLIGWGRNANAVVTEVDATGKKVFELTAHAADLAYQSYRVFRLPGE